MQLARWPNDGYTTIAAIPAAAGHNDDHGGTSANWRRGFTTRATAPRAGSRPGHLGAWVLGVGLGQHLRAGGHPRYATRLLTTRAPYGMYGFRAGQRFYFLNILEELSQPGEYYLDRATGMLYFWPPRPVETADIAISLLETPMIEMREACYVTIRDLTLEYARGCGVVINGGTHDLIGGCTVRDVGNYAVIVNGGTHHTVIGCDITGPATAVFRCMAASGRP